MGNFPIYFEFKSKNSLLESDSWMAAAGQETVEDWAVPGQPWARGRLLQLKFNAPRSPVYCHFYRISHQTDDVKKTTSNV